MDFIADYHRRRRNWPSDLDLAEFMLISPQEARAQIRDLIEDGLVRRRHRRLHLGMDEAPSIPKMAATQKATLERMVSDTVSEISEVISSDLRYRGRYAYLYLRTSLYAELIPVCRFGWTGNDEQWEFALPLPGGTYRDGLTRSGHHRGSILEILDTLFGPGPYYSSP